METSLTPEDRARIAKFANTPMRDRTPDMLIPDESEPAKEQPRIPRVPRR